MTIRDAIVADLPSIVAIYNASIPGRPAYRATAELIIYVAPACQGKGTGNALLVKAIEQAPQLRLKTLLGFIFAHNEGSLRLFEKFGFERWGVLPRVAELDGVEHDLIIVGHRFVPYKRSRPNGELDADTHGPPKGFGNDTRRVRNLSQIRLAFS